MVVALGRPNLLPDGLSPARSGRALVAAGAAQVAATSPDDVPGRLPHDRHVLRHGRGVCEPVLGGVVEEFDRQLFLALAERV